MQHERIVHRPFLPYRGSLFRLMSGGAVMRLSRKLRLRFYYSIPVAGAQVGWGRSEAYRAARRGDIPDRKEWTVRTRSRANNGTAR